MRVTVTISDELLLGAKRLARELAIPPQHTDRPAIPVFTGGSGPCPGPDLTSSRAVQESLDEGRPLDQLR